MMPFKRSLLLMMVALLWLAIGVATADYPKGNEAVGKNYDSVGTGYVSPETYRAPEGKVEAGACADCHEKVTPGAVRDWRASKHSRNGVDCSVCHGTDHTRLSMPTPQTCGACHADQLKGHQAGKHGVGWQLHAKAGRLLAQYKEMQEAGCNTCHSVEKKCDSCHTRHKFDAAEARKPEACSTCHMGPDHSQYEYYENSKHGVIYSAEGDTGRAPTCVTCHMVSGNHDVSQGITLGGASQGKFVGDTNSGNVQVKNPKSVFMNEITQADFDRERAKMVKVCSQCHSQRFATHKLENADAIKVASDGIAGEAMSVIEGLYKDGLLDPMPKDRMPHPIKGTELVLSGHQLYEQTSEIEAMFFRMYKFDLIHAWKGAYHMNPDYTHWYGNAPLKLDLDQIKGEARKLRRIDALEKEIKELKEKKSP